MGIVYSLCYFLVLLVMLHGHVMTFFFYLFIYSFCSILNKLTPEKFDVLKGQLIDTGITTPDILKVLI